MSTPTPHYISGGSPGALSWKCWRYDDGGSTWRWELRRFFDTIFEKPKDVPHRLRDERAILDGALSEGGLARAEHIFPSRRSLLATEPFAQVPHGIRDEWQISTEGLIAWMAWCSHRCRGNEKQAFSCLWSRFLALLIDDNKIVGSLSVREVPPEVREMCCQHGDDAMCQHLTSLLVSSMRVTDSGGHCFALSVFSACLSGANDVCPSCLAFFRWFLFRLARSAESNKISTRSATQTPSSPMRRPSLQGRGSDG